MALETTCAATGLSIGDRVLINGLPCAVTEINRDANLARLVEETSNRKMRRAFNARARQMRKAGATAA